MRTMRSEPRIGAILLAATLILAGCAGQDRAGPAAQASPHVIKLVTGIGPGVIERVATELDRRTGGAFRIEFMDAGHSGDPDFEHLMIEDALRGDVDFAWVGSRAWSSIGITAFEALEAPFLIDSYDLEERVLEDDSLLQPMADALQSKGLTLIGILPGPMRLLFSPERPYAAASDLDGAAVGISASRVAKLTFEALGATTTPMAYNGAPIDSVEVIESQASSVFGNDYDKGGGFLTTNVAFWPRPIVIFASRRAYDALSETDRTALREAVKAARGGVLEETRTYEAESSNAMCRRGTTLVSADEADLATLRTAADPVYQALNADPVTAGLIRRIEEMKAGSKADTEIPTCAAPTASQPQEVTAIDGTWGRCTTREEFLEAVHDPARGAGALESDADNPGNIGCGVMRFDRGTQYGWVDMGDGSGKLDATHLEHAGTYVIDGDRLEVQADTGETFVFGWRIFEDTLILSQVAGEISPTPVVVKPWARMAGPDGSPTP